MVYADVPSFFGLGLEDDFQAPTEFSKIRRPSIDIAQLLLQGHPRQGALCSSHGLSPALCTDKCGPEAFGGADGLR